MALPSRKTPIARCENASAFTQGALREYPILFKSEPDRAARFESLAGGLQAATLPLTAAQTDYRAAVLAVIPHRVRVKLADLRSADVVRSVKRAAEEAGRDVFAIVFPGGIEPIIKPMGQTEVDELRKLEDRIAAATTWPERDAHRARVVEVRKQYEKALEGRKAAMLEAANRRVIRDAIKEDFLDVFAEVAAAIEGEFPRDRRRQSVFFEDVSRGKKRDDDDGEDLEPA